MKSILILLILSIHCNLTSLAQDTLLLKKYVGNLKTIEVGVSNESFNFLFDTGGGETFISPEIASVLHKNLYGQSTGFRMNGDGIKYSKCDSVILDIGRQNLFHLSLGVWDVMSLLPEEFPQVDGVLSLKSFHEKKLTLDLSNNLLIIETDSSFIEKTNDMPSAQSKFANGLDGCELLVFLGIQNKSRYWWFLFDSSNLDNTLISHSTAFEWGLEGADSNTRKEFQNIEINLADNVIRMNSASAEIIYDGVLNYEFISQYRFYIDLRSNKIWME